MYKTVFEEKKAFRECFPNKDTKDRDGMREKAAPALAKMLQLRWPNFNHENFKSKSRKNEDE